MKRIVSVSILALTVAVFVSFGPVCTAFAQAKKVSKASPADKDVLVRIGTKTITAKDLELRMAALPPQYKEALQDEKAKGKYLEVLIQAQLFALAAKDEKIDKDAVVATQIEDAANSILAQEFVRRKLAGTDKVSDELIKKYYDENKGQLTNPTTVRVQHILVQLKEGATPEEAAAAQARADKLRKDLEGGADFGKVAEQHSDDQESKGSGGDLGYFSQEQMVPEISGPLFKMRVGEISRPIKSPFGYHIVKVNDRKEGLPMSLDEATPVIQSTLVKARQQKIMEDELERLKKKYKVTMTTS